MSRASPGVHGGGCVAQERPSARMVLAQKGGDRVLDHVLALRPADEHDAVDERWAADGRGRG